MDKDDEERTQKMIEQQIARALASKTEEVRCTCSYQALPPLPYNVVVGRDMPKWCKLVFPVNQLAF